MKADKLICLCKQTEFIVNLSSMRGRKPEKVAVFVFQFNFKDECFESLGVGKGFFIPASLAGGGACFDAF